MTRNIISHVLSNELWMREATFLLYRRWGQESKVSLVYIGPFRVLSNQCSDRGPSERSQQPFFLVMLHHHCFWHFFKVQDPDSLRPASKTNLALWGLGALSFTIVPQNQEKSILLTWTPPLWAEHDLTAMFGSAVCTVHRPICSLLSSQPDHRDRSQATPSSPGVPSPQSQGPGEEWHF